MRRCFARGSTKGDDIGARYFSGPKMPSMPPQTPPPPSRTDQEAEKAAAAQREAARSARGRRSTIIAGGNPTESLSPTSATLGGSKTLMGGGA